MPTLAELREAREKAGAVVIQLRDEGDAAGFAETPAFNARWDAANTAYNSALAAEENAARQQSAQADRRQLADRLHADANRVGQLTRSRSRPDFDPRRDPRSRGAVDAPTADEWGGALRLWAQARRPEFDPTEEDRALLRRCRVNLSSDEFHLPTGVQHIACIEEIQNVFAEVHPSQRRRAINQALASLNTMTPDSGAYVTTPPTVLQQLEINKLAWGGLLQVATIRTTTQGGDMVLPFTDDTTVKGRRIAEDGPLGAEVGFKFGLIKWGEHKYTSDVIPVTYEFARDTFISLDSLISEVGGSRLGRVQNLECTTGNGASMPRGISFSAPIGVTTASAVAITYDELIDLESSVDPAYTSGDRVGWMMHNLIVSKLRKLKDLEGKPILMLGQETGNRDQLFGRPVYINMDMPSTLAAGNDVILFGDFSKYWIRRVGSTRIVRDPYTKLISNDQELFAAVEYLDGNLVNAGTAPVKKMRMLPA